MVCWLGLYTFTAKGADSILGREIKIPQASGCGRKKKEGKNLFSSFQVYVLLGKRLTSGLLKVLLQWLEMGFPGSSAGKESACNVGDLGSIPGSGISLREGKGYPLQYSSLENSMDCIVHGVAKSRTWLNDFLFQEVGMWLIWQRPALSSDWLLRALLHNSHRQKY